MGFERSVRYLLGHIPCPLAGLGSRAAQASNRLAIDDPHTESSVDETARCITLRNDRATDAKTELGELVLLGLGARTDEQTVRLALELRFEKSGNTIEVRPCLHGSSAGKLVAAQVEQFELVLDNGHTVRRLDTESLLRTAIHKTPWRERLGRALIGVRSRTDSQTAGVAGASRVAALEIRLGLGPIGKTVVDAEVLAVDGTETAPRAGMTLAERLRTGSWEFRLAVRVNPAPARRHIARALFRLGLEAAPGAAELVETGLRKNAELRFRMTPRGGMLELAGAGGVPVDQAAEVARAFLEFDVFGAVVAEELRVRLDSNATAMRSGVTELIV